LNILNLCSPTSAEEVLGWAKISQGGLSGTVADPKVIYQIALKSNACSIILANNHPSGNLTPGEADIHLTRKLKEAGVLLDLPVLDHLIVSSEGYYSFAD
jgi:DNA repair protein RadC